MCKNIFKDIYLHLRFIVYQYILHPFIFFWLATELKGFRSRSCAARIPRPLISLRSGRARARPLAGTVHPVRAMKQTNTYWNWMHMRSWAERIFRTGARSRVKAKSSSSKQKTFRTSSSSSSYNLQRALPLEPIAKMNLCRVCVCVCVWLARMRMKATGFAVGVSRARPWTAQGLSSVELAWTILGSYRLQWTRTNERSRDDVCPQHKGYCACAAFSTYVDSSTHPNLERHVVLMYCSGRRSQ